MKNFEIKRINAPDLRATIASDVLHALPEWFGIPESISEYIESCRTAPFWTAFCGDAPAGFIAMKETGRATAEIHVMGVKKEYHRSGAGRALCSALEEYAREQGYEFLQVKTVKMGKYPEYDVTNRFYLAMGFREFECFPDLWDEANPCQIYVKHIG